MARKKRWELVPEKRLLTAMDDQEAVIFVMVGALVGNGTKSLDCTANVWPEAAAIFRTVFVPPPVKDAWPTMLVVTIFVVMIFVVVTFVEIMLVVRIGPCTAVSSTG